MPKWSDDFPKACETWAAWVDAGLDFAAAHPSRCVTVRNEDLSANAPSAFATIAEFLGVEPHPGPPAFFDKRRINSSWLNEGERPDDDDFSEWTGSRRKRFVSVAGATMARAGYGDADALRSWAHGR